MTETVIRHRSGFDDDGNPLPDSTAVLRPFRIAPGGGTRYRDTARDGSTVAFVVYFLRKVDLTTDDELTIRGRRCPIIINDWISGRFHGMEVLATEGRG